MAQDLDIDSMGIKALRQLITESGLSTDDCLEKSDLRQRAREARDRLAELKPSPARKSVEAKRFSGYECSVVTPMAEEEQPDLVILVFHGFGATSSDFETFPKMAHDLCTAKKVGWVFPQASQGQSGATEWWFLDQMKWFMAAQQGGAALAGLIREEPPGLSECRIRLKQLVSEVSAFFGGLPLNKLVLGGFSQGAMTAMDLALQLEANVAGVFMLSGAPMVVDQWALKISENHKGVKVFISHGMNDPVLPFAASGWCKDLLENGGADVQYVTHSGGHEVGTSTVTPLLRFWSNL